MKVRCKMKCNSVTTFEDSQQAEFSAVTGEDAEKEFFKYTPSADLTLQCLNRNVQFEPGETYYVDIILCKEVA